MSTWRNRHALILSRLHTSSNEHNKMEQEGAKRNFSFLQSKGLLIGKFILDRHLGIAKWMTPDSQPVTNHFYDIWHVDKSVTNSYSKLKKKKVARSLLTGPKRSGIIFIGISKGGFPTDDPCQVELLHKTCCG